MKEIEKLQRRLKDLVPTAVYEHSLRVQQRCVELASHYGADTSRAAIAGLLHDVAKRHSADELIYMAEQADLPITELVLSEPVPALHGAVGAAIIEKEFGITDREVLQAVHQHALGGEEMSMLSKVLYLANQTEPERQDPGMETVRALCLENLDEALVAAFDMMIRRKLAERSLILEQVVRSRNKAVLKLRRLD